MASAARGGGDAHGGGHVPGLGERRLGDRAAQAGGGVARVVRPGVGQQPGELVAARASDRVARADVGGHELADRAQHVVGHARAVAVVDPAEAVHVDEHQRQRPAVAAHALHLARQLVGEGLGAGQAGQGVGGRPGGDEAPGPLADHGARGEVGHRLEHLPEAGGQHPAGRGGGDDAAPAGAVDLDGGAQRAAPAPR